MLTGKKVAVLVAPQFHDEEAVSPRTFLEQKGVHVDWVGLDDAELNGKYGKVSLTPEKTIDQINARDYDGLIIPGGGAPERIRINETALKFVQEFWATGRPIGAICHGPQVLISADLVRGAALTSYIGIRDDLKLAGAKWVDKQVCMDGQLITSRTPNDLPAFNDAFTRAMAGDVVPEEEKELSPLDALNTAISREKGAFDFYTGMADIVKEEAVKNKFSYLAVIEQGHFDMLSEMYIKLSGGVPPNVDIKQNELGKHRVSPDITSQEAVELGILAEEKAYQC